uniref:Reverse transcriptase domain-containing protein n=1 Tax=Strongyloides venezuelensis TaxID=75913 RepID=A0A0K0FQ38_STRVS
MMKPTRKPKELSSPDERDAHTYEVRHFSIKDCYETWSTITSDKYVLNIVKNGIVIKTNDKYKPCNQISHDYKILLDKLQSLIEKEILIEKEKPRIIYDARHLNEFLTVESFKLEDAHFLLDSIPNRQFYAISFDISSAYYSIMVNEKSRHLFGVKYNNMTGYETHKTSGPNMGLRRTQNIHI